MDRPLSSPPSSWRGNDSFSLVQADRFWKVQQSGEVDKWKEAERDLAWDALQKETEKLKEKKDELPLSPTKFRFKMT